MLYRVYFGDGSEELIEAGDLQEAKDAVDDYGLDVSKVIALGESEDEDEVEDDWEDDCSEDTEGDED